MRFFYQIFINSPNVGRETVLSSKEVKTPSNNNSNSPLFNVNSNSNKKYQNNQQQQQQHNNNNTNNMQSTSNSIDTSVSNAKRPNDTNSAANSCASTSSTNIAGNNASDAKSARFTSVKSKANKTATKLALKGKSSGDESNGNNDDSCYSFSDEKPLKVAFVSSKNAKGSKTYNVYPAGNNGNSSPNGNGGANANKPDFKSLRSNGTHYTVSSIGNDSKHYNDSNKLNNSGTVTPNDSKEYKSNSPRAVTVQSIASSAALKDKTATKHSGDAKNKSKTGLNDGKGNRNSNAIINSPNIVVSIPQNRRVSFTDDAFENMSLADLKTANKKAKNGSSLKSNDDSNERKELPKLKIAISNLKAKITSPKIKDKSRKEPSPPYDPVLDYVGLKPVTLAGENSRSPDLKSDESSEHGHKKRKKSGKHSKEPGSKRRKLHAEISSQEEESLKLKVKITGGKPSKHERKNSFVSSDENSSSSTTSGSDVKEIESPRYSPTQKRRKQTPTPPSASPARVDDSNDDSSDVVFVSSTKQTSPKTVKFVTFKEPLRVPPVPKSNQPQPQTKASKPTFAVPVGKPKVAKPQTMSEMQAKGMFSPPHFPNYPTFHLPPPKLVSVSPVSPKLAPISAAPLKRSLSTDDRPQPPKQPKVESVARKQNIPNLIKATPTMKTSVNTNKSAQAKEVFYNSAMSSTYTREIHTKKPLPMLLPPASISVTEVSGGDAANSAYATSDLTGRPALEIVRINSNVPTVDQRHKQVDKMRPPQPQKAQAPQVQKSIRPMPPTIPLLKIKNASKQMKINAIADKMSREGEGNGVLDLSGRSSRSPTQSPSPPSNNNNPQATIISNTTLPRLVTVSSANTNSSQNMIIKSAPMSIAQHNFTRNNINNAMSKIFTKNMNSVPSSIASANHNKTVANDKNMIRNSDINSRDKLQSPPPLLSMMLPGGTRNLPVPKLNEIGKSRPNGPVRQQNASVRNVPNPSALLFRNQGAQPKLSAERSSPPTAVSVASSTSSTGSISASYKSQSPTLPAGNRTPAHSIGKTEIVLARKPNDRVTSGNNTSGITTPTTTTSLYLTSLTPISKQLKAPTLTKHHLLTSSDINSRGRNNNNDIGDAKSNAAKMSQIERVAANLRAAAANDANATQRMSLNAVQKNATTSVSS